MITLVGLGNTGTKIVEKLSIYEQYNIVTLDSGKEVKHYNTPEEYEKKCPSLKKHFKKLGDEVYLFLSASGNISGASLRILEQLKEYKTSVVCISSDPITLSSVGKLQQNLVTGVLQEYARSGLLESLYLLDNSMIEDSLVDVSIDNYWEEINNTIAYLFHINMFFSNSKPDFSLGENDTGIASIKTFGLMKNEEKKMLYKLKHITNEKYFLSYDKNNQKKVLQTAKKMLVNNNIKTGVFLYKSSLNEETSYFESATHIVQTVEEDNGEDKTEK